MSEVPRRSLLEVQTSPGEGWLVPCPTCDHAAPRGPDGACAACFAPLGDDLPTVAVPPPVLPFWKQRGFLAPLCFLIGGFPLLGAFAITALTGGGMEALWVLSILAGCLSLGTVPIAWGLWRSVYRTGRTRSFSSRMPLKKAWFEITKLRGRRGLLVHVSFLAHGFVTRRLEVVVRFRGPDGHYVRSTLRNYRGGYGELRARHLTDPVRNGLAAFRNLWLFVPIRALALPPGTPVVELTAEILLTCDGVVHTEHDLDVEFRPLPEDFPHLLPGSRGVSVLDPSAEGDAVVIVSKGATADAPVCGVCGDRLVQDVVTCSLCDTGHHAECWEYVGGCTTYACEGRPETAES